MYASAVSSIVSSGSKKRELEESVASQSTNQLKVAAVEQRLAAVSTETRAAESVYLRRLMGVSYVSVGVYTVDDLYPYSERFSMKSR